MLLVRLERDNLQQEKDMLLRKLLEAELDSTAASKQVLALQDSLSRMSRTVSVSAFTYWYCSFLLHKQQLYSGTLRNTVWYIIFFFPSGKANDGLWIFITGPTERSPPAEVGNLWKDKPDTSPPPEGAAWAWGAVFLSEGIAEVSWYRGACWCWFQFFHDRWTRFNCWIRKTLSWRGSLKWRQKTRSVFTTWLLLLLLLLLPLYYEWIIINYWSVRTWSSKCIWVLRAFLLCSIFRWSYRTKRKKLLTSPAF